MKNELLPSDYKDTLELIIQKIELAQQKAVISANITLLDLIGSSQDIIGYDGGAGSCINLNSYGALEATIEKLNVESKIDEGLKNTNLYRNNAWVMKNDKIALDWEK